MNRNFVVAVVLTFLLFGGNTAKSQVVERVYADYIATPQLFQYGNQQGMPIIRLNSADKLSLEFDDLQGSVKNYYYSFELYNYDWTPSTLTPFDYIKGFTQNRIYIYRNSSRALTRYTHYQAVLPEQGAVPYRSGNYMLRVFLDGDTSKTVFTKQMLVVDDRAGIGAQVMQPFTAALFNTHQRIKFNVALNIENAFSAAQQTKAVILQNGRWDIAQKDIVPTFIRGNNLEYNNESVGVFPAGKEWRWLDLRSLLLQSDRIDSGHYFKTSTELFVKPDADRSGQRYIYFPDYNGWYHISTYETINPFWQGDYATLHFSFSPPNGEELSGKDVYIIGGFTSFYLGEKWKMKWDAAAKVYKADAFLKQGYYNYAYVAVDRSNSHVVQVFEGNYWETENKYTVLLYYKSFTDRCEQLIGFTQVNSRNDKPGLSF